MKSRRPVAPEGLDGQEANLALWEPQQPSSGRSIRPSRVLGMVWCSIGSALVVMAPVVANVLIAFGMTVVMYEGQRRQRVLPLLASLVSGCGASVVLLGVPSVPSTVISIASAYAMAWMMTAGRLRTNGVIVTAVVVSCLMMGVDLVSTSLQGTTVSEVLTTAANEVVEQSLGSLDLSNQSALLEARDALVAYWPTLYLVVGVGTTLCSLAGAWMGVRTSGGACEPGMIARYDVPLWVAIAFAAGVLIELLGSRLPVWQAEAAMVGANVVMCARLLLAQQGLSVLLWAMRSKGLASPVRTLVVCLAVWLEMSFALTSVLGLLDVAVNFRHLARERADLALGPARER